MPPSRGTPCDINVTYTSLKITFNGLQFRRWQYGSIFICLAIFGYQICKIPRNSVRIRPYSRSRSSRVINLGVNLNVLNLENIGLFFPPLPCLMPRSGEPLKISGWNLPRKNYRDGATVQWKLHNNNFNRFRLIHQFVTDGWSIAYSVLSIYAICCRAVIILVMTMITCNGLASIILTHL